MPGRGGEPARQRLAVAQSRQMLHQVQPDGLADVVPVGIAEPEPPADGEDQTGVPVDDRVPRGAFAVARAVDQFTQWPVVHRSPIHELSSTGREQAVQRLCGTAVTPDPGRQGSAHPGRRERRTAPGGEATERPDRRVVRPFRYPGLVGKVGTDHVLAGRHRVDPRLRQVRAPRLPHAAVVRGADRDDCAARYVPAYHGCVYSAVSAIPTRTPRPAPGPRCGRSSLACIGGSSPPPPMLWLPITGRTARFLPIDGTQPEYRSSK